MTQLKNKNVKIKKDRQCFSCFRISPKGSIMNYSAGIVEGDFCTCYSCLTCTEIIAITPRNCFEYGVPEGFVRESLEKGETPERHLEKMLSEIKHTDLRIGQKVLVIPELNNKDFLPTTPKEMYVREIHNKNMAGLSYRPDGTSIYGILYGIIHPIK